MADQLQRILNEVYFSVDCEMDGPLPGVNSLLSLGCVAFTLADGFIGEFTVNLDRLPDGVQDPETMEFWARYPAEYALTRIDTQAPRDAMYQFALFTAQTARHRSPIFAAYPAPIDFAFAYWNLVRFLGADFNPFKWVAWDFKSYAMAVLKQPFNDTTSSSMPAHWSKYVDPNDRIHIALPDARRQACQFIACMTEHLGVPNPMAKTLDISPQNV